MGLLDTLNKLVNPISAVGDIAGGIFGAIQANKQAKAQKAYNNANARNYNDYLDARKGEVQSLLDDIMAAGGGNPFGPQTSRSSSMSSMSGSSETEGEDYTAPEILSEYQPLSNLTRSLVEGRLASGSSLPAGYQQMGLQNIDQTMRGAQRAQDAFVASRGLSPTDAAMGSPVATERQHQVNNFLTETPLKERELQNQDIGLASSLMEKFGTAQRRKSTSKTRSRSNTMGSSTSTGPADYGALANLVLTPGPRAAYQ